MEFVDCSSLLSTGVNFFSTYFMTSFPTVLTDEAARSIATALAPSCNTLFVALWASNSNAKLSPSIDNGSSLAMNRCLSRKDLACSRFLIVEAALSMSSFRVFGFSPAWSIAALVRAGCPCDVACMLPSEVGGMLILFSCEL